MINKLCDFLDSSPTAFNAVDNVRKILKKEGFIELFETKDFDIKKNSKYFIIRNNSSIIAFNIPSDIKTSIKMIASHTDSPSLKIKPNFKIEKFNTNLIKTEPYGGLIYSSWFDRPLGVAGRVMLNKDNKILEKIVNINKDLLVIPNLCIHFNREINNGYKYDPTIDLNALISNDRNLFDVLKENNINEADVLSHDLYLYNRDKARIVGANNEFLLSPRLDNLSSLYLSLEAFLNSNDDSFKVFISFDNEETGSSSKQGACSDFLINILTRIYESLGYDKNDFYKSLRNSVLISADNAHALHPNYISNYDIDNAPILNKGFAIKFNASQHYTTDAITSAIVKKICKNNNIPYQDYANKSNIRGGSTLGNLLLSSVSINMADIGLPQLAMHSANELVGVNDIISYYDFMKHFYETNINIEEFGINLY